LSFPNSYAEDGGCAQAVTILWKAEGAMLGERRDAQGRIACPERSVDAEESESVATSKTKTIADAPKEIEPVAVAPEAGQDRGAILLVHHEQSPLDR
jgi:hypothetical protein